MECFVTCSSSFLGGSMATRSLHCSILVHPTHRHLGRQARITPCCQTDEIYRYYGISEEKHERVVSNIKQREAGQLLGKKRGKLRIARNVERLIQAGKSLESKGKHSRAAYAYRRAIRVSPSYGRAWQSLANVYKSLEDTRNTRVNLSTEESNGFSWIPIAPSNGIQEFRGSLYLRRKRRVLIHSLRHCKGNFHLLQSLGQLEFKLGNIDVARGLFELGIRESTLSGRPHGALYNSLGLLEQHCGNVDKARILFEQGLKILQKASVMVRSSFRSQAASIRLSRMYLLSSLSKLEFSEGNFVVAEKLAREASAQDGFNAVCLQHLGRCLISNHKYNEAFHVLQRAKSVNPMNIHVRHTIAELYAKQNRNGSARAEFAAASELPTCDVLLLHAWSWFEFQKRHYTKSREILHLAFRLARELRLADKTRESDKAYPLSVQANSSAWPSKRTIGDSVLWCLAGRLQMVNGRYDCARRMFRKGLGLNPRDWVLMDTWSCMEWKLGNDVRSQKLLENSFAIRFNAQGAFSVLANSLSDRPRPF